MLLSIIIPVLNEERALPSLLTYLKNELAPPPHSYELIVVDGGSRDRSIEFAREYGAKVVPAGSAGRGYQLNRGAANASGDLLFFLHVDSYPPAGFRDEIRQAFRRGFKAGCFQLSFYPDSPLLRFYAWFTRFNINAFRYGDQGLFVGCQTFNQAGGFREDLAVMEDNEIIPRIRRHTPFYISKQKVKTSSRKYRRCGMVRLQITFICIYLMFQLGASQEVLVHFYRKWIG